MFLRGWISRAQLEHCYEYGEVPPNGMILFATQLSSEFVPVGVEVNEPITLEDCIDALRATDGEYREAEPTFITELREDARRAGQL